MWPDDSDYLCQRNDNDRTVRRIAWPDSKLPGKNVLMVDVSNVRPTQVTGIGCHTAVVKFVYAFSDLG